ncbi:hypothetical protein J7T55_003465 [Diaporthe amygdali]|uniref:uncharacterized protein n=1 Tax=Phomopsis amygdali TaxID=1214568 RepID=UPI0022FED2F5|nr:uncharacterized protein J7T55_003465 [Diaporthe amygdali]KAJ0117049.1 hypothetical protein J7T55_003465 [Diaporthe amygdali]
MSIMRGNIMNATSRAILRPRLQPHSRRAVISRRSYASDMPEHPPSRTEGTSGLPWLIGAVAVILPTTFWFLSSGQKATHHNDHDQQKALRSSHPGIMNTPHKDIETKADGSDSDLPEDAPNRPDNREKIEKKLAEKPATKRVDPMK